MEKKQFENNNFVLYAPDSLKHVFKDLESILDESLDTYKELFDVDDFRQVEIHYFDNLDEFRNYIYELRGEKESLPEYARGTFDNGMIIAYIDPSIKESDTTFNKRVHLASHELFHIMYKELVFKKLDIERIVWFDEGCAQFFSGEKDYELNEGFNEWFNKVKSETKVIPELNKLSHGKSFKTTDYNGYNLSLLAVKNLYDVLGYDAFKELLTNSNSVIKYGYGILEDAFLFYDMELEDNRVK